MMYIADTYYVRKNNFFKRSQCGLCGREYRLTSGCANTRVLAANKGDMSWDMASAVDDIE